MEFSPLYPLKAPLAETAIPVKYPHVRQGISCCEFTDCIIMSDLHSRVEVGLGLNFFKDYFKVFWRNGALKVLVSTKIPSAEELIFRTSVWSRQGLIFSEIF